MKCKLYVMLVDLSGFSCINLWFMRINNGTDTLFPQCFCVEEDYTEFFELGQYIKAHLKTIGFEVIFSSAKKDKIEKTKNRNNT